MTAAYYNQLFFALAILAMMALGFVGFTVWAILEWYDSPDNRRKRRWKRHYTEAKKRKQY